MEWKDDGTGKAKTKDHWYYKAPVAADVPSRFNVSYAKLGMGTHNFGQKRGVFGGKGTGEPPILMAVSIMAALRHAVEAGRKETGKQDWHPLDCPLKPYKLSEACGAAASLATEEGAAEPEPEEATPP
jgi:xanthine dehydrogenase molybdopterin-binding subunit B